MSDAMKDLRAELGITDDVLTVCARTVYDLLKAGRPEEAAKAAKGLVVADKKNAYYRTLLATALLRKGDYKAALAVVDEGLTHQPGHADLSTLRTSLAKALTPAAAG
jgi:predicted Zn-dependent protease